MKLNRQFIFAILLLFNLAFLTVNIVFLFRDNGPVDQLVSRNETVEVEIIGHFTTSHIANGKRVDVYKLEVDLDGVRYAIKTNYTYTIFSTFQKEFPLNTKLLVKMNELEKL